MMVWLGPQIRRDARSFYTQILQNDQSSMIKVIINADDLGKNDRVNAAIGKAFAAHLISSSSIMANSGLWDEVHEIVKQNPQASFGIHLNLTEGKALTENPVLFQNGIVDENNCFTKKVRSLSNYTNDILLAIKNEWLAQISKVIEIEGIKVSHVDGHHHIHTFYPFYDILIDCLNHYGISKIRNRYTYPRNFSSSILLGIVELNNSNRVLNFLHSNKEQNGYIKYLYNVLESNRWRKLIGQTLITTTYFDSYEHFLQKEKFLNKKIDTTIELMCHPGHPTFEKEFNELKNHQLDSLIPFNLISYKEL